MATSSNIVGRWSVSLPDGKHIIKFSHLPGTGKRVIWVDGKEIFRKNWNFDLVGKLEFQVSSAKAVITIEAARGFNYEYRLFINGLPSQKFRENRKKTTKLWTFLVDDIPTRVVLEKDTMDVWVNGKVIKTTGEFVEDGTETHFEIESNPCYIKAVSSGRQKEGIIHTLVYKGNIVPESSE